MSARHIDYAELDVPLQFRTPTDALQATACALTLVSDDGAVVECSIELRLDLPAYRRVDAERLFHLDPQVRGLGAQGFAPDDVVAIEARLEPELLALLLAGSPTPLEAGERLGELSRTQDDSALLSSESWYALTVGTPVQLPDELAEDGSLQTGYSTRWTSDDGPRLRLSMLAIVEQLLEDHGWEPDDAEEEDEVIRWRMHTAHGSWSSYALARELDDRLAVYSVLNLTVPEDRLHDGALLVTRANQGLPVGNWELDLDDGTLRYKTSIDLGGERLSMALAGAVIERNLAVVDAYLEGFAAFAEGRMSVDEALAHSEG